MPSKNVRPVLFGFLCLFSASILAQDKAARDRLTAAHAQYYTPTASGLKSFHCEASIDWKDMLTRFAGTEIPDDNPFLKYLQTVHLSVTDDLKGKGAMQWSSTETPPEGKKDSVAQLREGLMTMMDGFFQDWNTYMNGGMVPLPDKSVTVKTVAAGIHLHGTTGDTVVDEDFDKNNLLTQVAVLTPAIKVVATPTYISTSDGLVVSGIKSLINQPPTAPQTEAAFRVAYTRVESFQIPSNVVVDIKNTGSIEVAFSACQVSLADWAQKKK